MHKGIQNLDSYLKKFNKYIISTHESPDGDGLGAEIALKELLTGLGKETVIINSDPTPEKFEFIDIDNEINVYSKGYTLPDNLIDYGVFVVDTNDLSNIGSLNNNIKDRIKDIFIIDHHEGGKDLFESNYIKVDASSSCEILYGLLIHYKMEPGFKSAQALYAGILFDTGSFRYPKTSKETFSIIAHLVELGASPFNIYEEIYENNSLESFELRGMMLSSMQILYGGKLVIMKLTPEMLKESGAPFSEGESNINLPHTVKGVIASVLVKQDIGGPIKVSMRTKGDYDVAKIAIANGGGGHKNASGYKSKLSFEETCEKVLKETEHFFIS